MLVLSRKANETIRISDDVIVTIVSVDGGTVKLGIDAPDHISVHRGEVYERIQEENRRAAITAPTEVTRLAHFLTKQGKAESE